VCIQQTVIDLLKRGYEVHVIADATSYRSQMDRLFAFEVCQSCFVSQETFLLTLLFIYRDLGRLELTVTTSESVLFQLIGDKDHPHFKAIQGLIKTSAPVSGLVPHL
jgi:hypothetical protein